ncbi:MULTISPECIES: hypothetical protein [unclassified Flavobacterium]|uniref:hypothetical protein n=1 Tax=unclassified Flavobacterium TaxID=196869 RepID=UPI000F0C8744|nr:MULTISPECIES: hypothetical protein [unclassified Flavobacterium]AYN04219.1 hypothetical protein EAG11_08445 [Flavobacterium sp. 140616W15]MCD0475437.1 hypothetical protein [Flavobacterium sp. EDS]
MSSESQLKFRGRQLWINDAFLLPFYIFLFDQLKNENKEFTDLQNELVTNIDNILEYTFGFLNFTEFIFSDEMKDIVINHIENIITKINEEDNYFSLENLETILSQVKTYHLKNLDYEPCKKIINDSYGNDFFLEKNNSIKEFIEIKSLLEKAIPDYYRLLLKTLNDKK